MLSSFVSKKFPVAGVLMTLFVLGLFGAMGYLVVVLQNQSDKNAAVLAENQPSMAKQKKARATKKSTDGVMGNLLPERSARLPRKDTNIEIGVMPDMIGVMPPTRPNDATMGKPMMNDPAMAEPMENEPDPEPESTAPSPQMAEMASKALEDVRAAIRSGEDKAKLMSQAEMARDGAVSDEQRAAGEALVRLIHYASEYQAAIDRSVPALNVGEGWTIREGVIVGVVEVTPEKLILKVQGRNKEYDLAKLPSTIADALAKQSLPPDEALFSVFRAAWQCLQPEATEADREDAIAQWQGAAGKSADADVSGLAEELKAIFK